MTLQYNISDGQHDRPIRPASASRWSLAGASAGSLLLHGFVAAAVLAAALAGQRPQGDEAAIMVFIEPGTAPVAAAQEEAAQPEEARAEPAAASAEAVSAALPPPPDDSPPPVVPQIDYAPPPPEEALAPPDFKPPPPPPPTAAPPPPATPPTPPAKPTPRPPVQAKPAPTPAPSRGPVTAAPQAPPSAAPPGPATSPAPGAAAAAPAPASGWNALLATWLTMHKVYPEAARRRSEEGDVTVRFVVAPDGRVSDVSLVKGSGSQALDAAALAMLKGATVPAPGVEATRTVRVRYSLRE